MNTNDVLQGLKVDPDVSRRVFGVYTVDSLPKLKVFGDYFVVMNAHDHWTVLSVPARLNEPIEYFDPLAGVAPPEVKRFATDRKRTLYEWPRKIQGDGSYYCGMFCVCYIYCRSYGLSMKEVKKLFDGSFEANDAFVLNFYATLMP